MELEQIQSLLDKIKGCTFASLDAVCKCTGGVSKTVWNERVILFSCKGSGYANMVRRRLQQAGKNPEAFTVGPLPWGERVDDGPLIVHKDKYYLQTLVIQPGEVEYFVGLSRVNPSDIPWVRPHIEDRLGLGVVVHTYALESITAIRLMGEEVTD